ncbi:hypothetical protein [Rodentibacter ratti]|uniref:hypothetical protein n=1 Tax=Rodentibacter ratti TaxID=1906745 RepID=UPI0015C36EB8|nr:hypothetical protein [Rodentibacter ratti]
MMSKRVKNTTVPKGGFGYYKTLRCKASNNAKRNKTINGGTTAATAFYLRWSY